MKVTTVVQVQGDPSALLTMMRQFNTACNWLSPIAFEERLFHWLPLQRRAYHELRERFGVTAAEATVIVRKVAYSYKAKSRRKHLATFQPLGAIPVHRIKYDGTRVRVYGYWVSCKARPKTVLPKKALQATLVYRDGRLFIHQTVDIPELQTYEPQGFLGCDLGIVNILADSDGLSYSGGHLNGLRHRHARLRRRLQSKGTRSAKRLLRKRRRKERRFARWVNHGISKRVVAKAKMRTWGIALEDLQGIRERVQVRKAQRRQHHAWSFNQLRSFIQYKARFQGVPVALVDPRNTSRTCPACGLVDKANRVSQAQFLCVSCGFAGLADTIAALNIQRGAAGGQPYAATPVSCEFFHGFLAVKG